MGHGGVRGTKRIKGVFFSGQAKGLFGSESVILECTNFSVGTAQAMQREAADNLINQDRATVKNDFRCLRRYFPFCYGRATSLCRSIAWTRRRRMNGTRQGSPFRIQWRHQSYFMFANIMTSYLTHIDTHGDLLVPWFIPPSYSINIHDFQLTVTQYINISSNSSQEKTCIFTDLLPTIYIYINI